jgi:hypothetical protein
MPYDLQNYTVTFQRSPLSLTISATVTDAVTGQVKGTVSVSFPTDLSLVTDSELRSLLERLAQAVLAKKVAQAGWA